MVSNKRAGVGCPAGCRSGVIRSSFQKENKSGSGMRNRYECESSASKLIDGKRNRRECEKSNLKNFNADAG
jgi:hypothetical protein